MDKEAPLKIKLKSQERSDPVYAVNEAGDFSKKSVREPDWPANAEEKKPLAEINENRSDGAKRFENVIARVIQLGELPRGIVGLAVNKSNGENDSAMGVVTLPESDPQKSFENRLESLAGDIEYSKNHPVSIELPKSRAKMTDKNNPGVVDLEGRKSAIETATAVDAPFIKKKEMINPGELKSRELKTL